MENDLFDIALDSYKLRCVKILLLQSNWCLQIYNNFSNYIDTSHDLNFVQNSYNDHFRPQYLA